MKLHWYTSSHNVALYILGGVMNWLWYSAPSSEYLIVSLSWESPRSTNPSPYLHSNSRPTVISSLSPLFCLFRWSTYLKSYRCSFSPPWLLGVFKVCINFFCVFRGLIALFFQCRIACYCLKWHCSIMHSRTSHPALIWRAVFYDVRNLILSWYCSLAYSCMRADAMLSSSLRMLWMLPGAHLVLCAARL